MNVPMERIVDQTFSAWVRRRTQSDLLARAAFAVCRDEGLGHSCASLRDDAEFSEIDLDRLRAERWVGDGTDFTPFVLSPNGDFYTWRNWRNETDLARALRERATNEPVDASMFRPIIEELFAGTDSQATASQRSAVAACVGKRVFVVTGGPGTGKTSTALRMLLMLLHENKRSPLAIALAAPTGKAVQRLTQSIAAGKSSLLKTLSPESSLRGLLDHVPHARVQTLHRLLGFRSRENTFARNATSPIAADVILVDETSMVDLATMRQLFDAARRDAVVILLGDPGQLYAIEAGSVLGDIVGSVDRPDAPLAANIVALTHGWRAEANLDASLRAVRDGDAAWASQLLHDGAMGGVRWRDTMTAASVTAHVAAWIDDHASTFDTLMRDNVTPTEALAALRSLQILCALRETPFGSRNVNALIERECVQRFGIDAGSEWHHGRPVIVTRNDYARDLFNGDVGIALRGDNGLRVWFETRDRDGAFAVRSFSTRTLPAHETAWAITIHRSQGSEYGDVAVVLPPQPEHRILSRELVYTAMSRASRRVELWTSPGALRSAVARPVQRRGGLRDRLSNAT